MLLVHSIGLWVGFMGMFNDPEWTTSNVLSMLAIAVVFGLLYSLIFLGFKVLLESNNTFPANMEIVYALYLPLQLTCAFFVVDRVSIFGSWGNPAYSFVYESTTLRYLVSVFGLSAINFVSLLGISALAFVLISMDNKVKRPETIISIRNGVTRIFIVVVILALCLGSAVKLNIEGFYQRGVDVMAPATSDYLKVSCIVHEPGASGVSYTDMMLNKTKELIEHEGSQLILWRYVLDPI